MKLDENDIIAFSLTLLVIIGFISVVGAVCWGIWNVVSTFV